MLLRLLHHVETRLQRVWPVAPLRTWLVAVILLATLPIAILMSAQFLLDMHARQAQADAGLVRAADALAQAVDSELVASLDALAALSHADVLARREPAQLQRLLQARPLPRREWHSIFLLDDAGAVRFDTAPADAGGPQAAALAALHAAVRRSGQPAVSGVVAASGRSPALVLLAVPVRQDGAGQHVLGARVPVSVLARIAAGAGRPPGAQAGIVDAALQPIADTGQPLPAPSTAALRGRPGEVRRVDAGGGVRLQAVSQAVAAAPGWAVQLTMPSEPADAARRKALLGALAASLGTLLGGVLLAAIAARGIARPLQQLAQHGHAGVRGPVPVEEIGVLRDALQHAADQDEAARAVLETRARELQAAGEQLRESQRLMELAQEAGNVGFFQYRVAADELVWTPGQCRLFGIEALPGAGIGHWFDRVDAADRARVEREFWTACALQRDKETLDYGVRRADGSTRWLSSRVQFRYDERGAVTQAIGVTVDMSDQREAELQRAQLTERAVAARAQAEAASRAKDEFLTMLSHELRNPLGAISAAVDVLEAAPDASPAAADARAIVARQTRNLAHMMNDLLDVGRVLSGRIVLARRPVNLAAVLDRVRRTLELTREGAGHVIAVQAADAWVDGDAVRLEQVMGKLIANAIKYTPPGRRITVTVERRGADAVFAVEDAGPGIPPALLPHIFDLFVQGERTLDRRAGGLGIGLTLVRRLVELHGGRVGAESSGKGSCFTVAIPAVDAPPQARDDTLPPSRRRKVLVIEDNPDVLAALRAKLELDGHTVSTAADGIEGLSRLLRQQPEVSIVDIGLPGLTGYEVARHARAAGYAGRMVALSGYGAERDVRDALVAGFDAYLVKPVERLQLRSSLVGDDSLLPVVTRADGRAVE